MQMQRGLIFSQGEVSSDFAGSSLIRVKTAQQRDDGVGPTPLYIYRSGLGRRVLPSDSALTPAHKRLSGGVGAWAQDPPGGDDTLPYEKNPTLEFKASGNTLQSDLPGQHDGPQWVKGDSKVGDDVTQGTFRLMRQIPLFTTTSMEVDRDRWLGAQNRPGTNPTSDWGGEDRWHFVIARKGDYFLVFNAEAFPLGLGGCHRPGAARPTWKWFGGREKRHPSGRSCPAKDNCRS